MFSLEAQKHLVAKAALAYIEPGMIVGIGTGSTTNAFIEALAAAKIPLECCVASSLASEQRLKEHRLPYAALTSVPEVHLYVDGADECTSHKTLLKGGGGALTREKILAVSSHRFLCIVDESKLVPVLGKFPLPIEVIPMARSLVARRLVALGGSPVYREGCITDNGHIILDIYDLDLSDPAAMETTLNQIPGVICNGLFAHRKADVLLVATNTGEIHTY